MISKKVILMSRVLVSVGTILMRNCLWENIRDLIIVAISGMSNGIQARTVGARAAKWMCGELHAIRGNPVFGN